MSPRLWWLAVNFLAAALLMFSFAGVCLVLVGTVARIGGLP